MTKSELKQLIRETLSEMTSESQSRVEHRQDLEYLRQLYRSGSDDFYDALRDFVAKYGYRPSLGK